MKLMKSKKSAYLALALCFTISAFFCGCKDERHTASASAPTIALVMKTLNNPFFIDMEKGAKEAAKRLGVNLLVQAAEREIDVEKQMQIVENLIQRKVQAICVTPSGSREIVPSIVKANQADVPVLVVDTRVDQGALHKANGKTATFIGSDNVEGGRLAGDYMVKRLQGKGKILVLEGVPGHETGDARLKGFREAISREPGLQVAASQTANWERDQGYNVVQNLLQAQTGVRGIFACNDLMALGAVEAIAAARKTGQIVVVGFDATDDARRAILKGTMDASVAQHPVEMGKLAVESAVALVRGTVLPAEIPVPVDLVTRDSLEKPKP